MTTRRATLLGLALTPVMAAAQVHPGTGNATETEALTRLPSDGIRLEFPRLADTGAAVPLEASLVAPAGTHISRIDVLLPLNPNILALRLNFPQPVARFQFGTRLRLAATQDAWVVMTLTDGTRRGASAPTIITSSACFDES